MPKLWIIGVLILVVHRLFHSDTLKNLKKYIQQIPATTRQPLLPGSHLRYYLLVCCRSIKSLQLNLILFTSTILFTTGRPIIYTDESYVGSSHSSQKAWTDGTTKGLKKPISKGQRVVIVHAGSETGFIPNALLTFKAGTKSGDYHDNMNFENYEKWLKSQLMRNLPANSVVVAWLTEKGIQHEKTQLKKPQLYNLIKANKERFIIDRILAEQGHQVLRLPPYHPDLNPIKTIKLIIQVNGDSSDDSIDESDENESTSADDRSSPEPGPRISKALIPLKD
ncbi:hypothetical protein ABMA28_003498 [Loxostege sticticalis]|uniref:Transposase n=1 Tax=Loxostege sticticalis TaxID=481309 RepID=A0ABD0SWP0_LOXSC